MRLAINLRRDLAELSDIELAERLERAWQAHDAIRIPDQTRHRFWRSEPMLFRGPIRHPRAYRFLAVMPLLDWELLGLILALLWSSKRAEAWLRTDPNTDRHLALCEIRDIMDEMERRVGRRRRASAEPPGRR